MNYPPPTSENSRDKDTAYMLEIFKNSKESNAGSVPQIFGSLSQLMKTFKDKVDKLDRMHSERKFLAKEDGSSDSEEGGRRVEKYFSSSGMSSLSIPMQAYYNTINKEAKETDKKIFFKRERYCYFETEKLSDSRYKDVTTDPSTKPNFIFIDANPCVNGKEAPLKVETIFENYKEDKDVKVLVVDITSSTTKQLREIKAAWERNFKKEGSNHPYLVFASSGIKHRQLGIDYVPFGENKLFVFKETEETKEAKKFRKRFRKLTSGQSSNKAHIVRHALAKACGQYEEDEAKKKNSKEKRYDDDRKPNLDDGNNKPPKDDDEKDDGKKHPSTGNFHNSNSSSSSNGSNEVKSKYSASDNFSDYGEKEEKITTSSKTEVVKAIQDEWYSDAEIIDLLRVTHGDNLLLPGTHGVNTIVQNGEQLEEILKEIPNGGQYIIPMQVNVMTADFETNNNHWIGLRIDMSKETPLIEYINPMGFDLGPGIKDILKERFGKELPIKIFDETNCPQFVEKQGEGEFANVLGNSHDCGPFLVEAFRILAIKGNIAEMYKHDIEDSIAYGRELRSKQRKELQNQKDLSAAKCAENNLASSQKSVELEIESEMLIKLLENTNFGIEEKIELTDEVKNYNVASEETSESKAFRKLRKIVKERAEVPKENPKEDEEKR